MNARRLTIFLILLVVILLSIPFAIAQDFGTNWTADYFSNRSFSGTPVLSQGGLTGVNFDWGSGSPVAGTIPNDEFSIRFSSAQSFVAGTYQFTLNADDGARIFIDGAVLSETADAPRPSIVFNRDMTPGSHNLVIEYVEGTGEARVQFSWTLLNPAAGVVPETPVPIALATISGVRGQAVRSGPYLGATLLRVALPDQPYPVLARNLDEGVFTWYKISLPSGTIGWASGRFITLNVDPNVIPIEGSVFDTLGSPPETGVTAAPRSVMNMRRQPSQRTDLIVQIPVGVQMPLLNRTAQGGENFWYQVNYEGQIGWIYAPFVSTNGPIDDVPIR